METDLPTEYYDVDVYDYNNTAYDDYTHVENIG